MKFRIVILLMMFFVLVDSDAQKFVYDVDFLSYFDNRESGVGYYESGTLLGLRVSPEIGLDFVDAQGGEHRLMGGVSYVQPLGKSWKAIVVQPTAYYRYKYRGFQVAMGAIPYRSLMQRVSSLSMSDDLRYRRANLYGAHLAYSSALGYVESYCDWRAMPTETTREAFRIVLSGQYKYKMLIAGGYAHMGHLANKAKTEPNEGVCDDVVVMPHVGIDFTDMTPMDSLSLRFAYLGGMQRNRKTNETFIPSGGVVELYLRWKWIGAANMFYIGEPQMALYAELGSELYQGAALYSHGVYNKTSIFASIVRKEFVNLSFYFNLHYVPGFDLATQQQLVVNFNLEALIKKKSRVKNFFTL